MNDDDDLAILKRALNEYEIAVSTISGLIYVSEGTDLPPVQLLREIRKMCVEATTTVELILSEATTRRIAPQPNPTVAHSDTVNLDAGNVFVPEEFVVFDLETTGLNADFDEIIEIGAILVRRSQIISGDQNFPSLQSFVRIQSPVPVAITRLTGITQSMINEHGVPLLEALEEFRGFIGDRRLVAYNAKFDMGFMSRAMKRSGFKMSNSVSCALQMARRAWPDRPSFKLKDLAREVPAGQAHRAIADCIRAMVVYIAAVRKLHVES